MNAKGLLDQLLRSGETLMRDQLGGGGQAPAEGTPRANGLAGVRSAMGGFGGGAVAGGALGLLLGNKRVRKMGGKALTYGGIAALGVLAYKAYQGYQAQQPGAGAEPRTIDRLPAPEVERQSRCILKALVAAAKADGHVDDRERELIEAELARLDGDPQLQAWLDAELRRPLDPAEVAAVADTPELAAEMYLASRLMVDEESFMERAYLDELVRRLGLDPDLRQRLDAEVAAARAA